MKTFKRLRVFLTLLSAAAFVSAAIPASAASPQDSLQKLYEAAKGDKEVTWQWFSATKQVNAVISAFQKKYPDIKLSVVSIAATMIPTRIIVESNAGKVSVDVGTAGTSYLLPVIERDLLARYNWPQLVDANPKFISYDGRLVNFTSVARVWIYNTKLVSKAEAPKTWGDTLDPKWKGGKIVVRAAPSGFNLLFPMWKQDKEKAIDYLRRLAKQDIVLGLRAAEVVNRIATGESPLSISSITSSYDAIKSGAPLALCPIGPTASEPSAFFIPKGAPHPNAAKLLLGWMASPEGRRAFLEAGFGPHYPPDASPQAKMLADNGIGFVSIESPEDLREYTGPFTETVIKVLGFKPK